MAHPQWADAAGTPVDRRALIAACGLTALGMGWPLRTHAAREASIPQKLAARVIVDNDFAGDPDAWVALAHQLLSPRTRTTLITCSPLFAYRSAPAAVAGSTATGKEFVAEMVARGSIPPVPVLAGAESFGDGAEQLSDGARAIVAEAMRDDPLPLFITCGGPLTNVAAALRIEPRIAERATLIWIGGGAYPGGGWEYNLTGDIASARQVIERSAIPLWQVPQPAYRQLQMSMAELAMRLRPVSPLGAWLYERFTQLPSFIEVGGSWAMGDSATVLLTALSPNSSLSEIHAARCILPDGQYGDEIPGRLVREFKSLDARLTIEDFLARLALHASGVSTRDSACGYGIILQGLSA